MKPVKNVAILYSFRRCPYAMRARLALYSAKIDHEHREVDLKNKPQDMLAISPKGTVPVMQLIDGTVLEQSLDIMNWALDNPRLPTNGFVMITENDTTFKYALDRYKYPGRYKEEEGFDYRAQGQAFLAKLEESLSPYLMSKTESLLDMAIFPFVRQFVKVDPEWFQGQPYPRLKIWLNDFVISDKFKQVMQNYKPWFPGDEPIWVSFNGS